MNLKNTLAALGILAGVAVIGAVAHVSVNTAGEVKVIRSDIGVLAEAVEKQGKAIDALGDEVAQITAMLSKKASR